VALLAPGTRDWVVSELGILYIGALSVPLSVKLEVSEIFFRLKHAEAKVLVTTKFFYKKLVHLLPELPGLKKVVLLDLQENGNTNELSLDELFQIGSQYLLIHEDEFDSHTKAVEGNSPAIITYTSGTTSDPKGIVLSHKNLVTNSEQSLKMFSLKKTDKTLLILPLDHSFAHTAGMFVFISAGASLASVQQGGTPNETIRNIQNNILEVKPDILLSVPTLAKNLKQGILKEAKNKGFIAEKIFNWGLQIAYKYYGNGWNRGRGYRKLYKPLNGLIQKFVFSKIRKNFGGNLKYFVGGGALLDLEIQKFFFAIGIPMYQGYGLSEASPVISVNTNVAHKMGSSGRVVPGLQAKICDEEGNEVPPGENGEIVVKGDNVMLEYYKNKEATEEAIRDGWLYTGDLGYFDTDGFLFVLGRYKSLLISNDGEKFSPEGIEEHLIEKSKYISQVMVYNNQNKYTVAIIFPDKKAIDKYLEHKGLSRENENGQKAAIELLKNQIMAINKEKPYETNLPDRWLPVTFSIIVEGFTIENHFLNSTLKMVRNKITDFYKERIEYMYTIEGKDIFNIKNFKAVKKL
jgi:long-chain acyl-CoA synthetase